MKNVMQLKAIIKKMAKEKKISAQIILQNYMLERLLERISLSSYKENFILKGGFLIASIFGLDTRATMDIDATLKSLVVNIETVTKMFEDISEISLKDEIVFKLKSVNEIREAAEYAGFRISVAAHYHQMVVPLKLDLTTGDSIIPRAIVYKYNLLFEPRSIEVLAYDLETIIAEKVETIISRSDQNTRPRDFYDIYIIYKFKWDNVDVNSLKMALKATSSNRNTAHILKQYNDVIKTIETSDEMKKHWVTYQNQFDYAKEISFEEICIVLKEVLYKINRR